MSKEDNEGLERSAVGKASEPGLNTTADAGKKRTHRTATWRDRERPTMEPGDTSSKHNKTGGTGSSTDPKRRIGCVKLSRGQNSDVLYSRASQELFQNRVQLTWDKRLATLGRMSDVSAVVQWIGTTRSRRIKQLYGLSGWEGRERNTYFLRRRLRPHGMSKKKNVMQWGRLEQV